MNNTEAIHEHIAKYLSGEASPEEAQQAEAWGNESMENKAYLEECFRIFNLSSKEFEGIGKAECWINIEANITTTQFRPGVKKTWVAGIAACLLLVLAGVLLNTKQDIPSNVVYKSEAVSKTVFLQDSTEIKLSPYTTAVLDKRYGSENRNITLKGSASFSVKHDEDRPVVVSVENIHIKDLGTRFTILTSSESGNIDVTVEEGTVLVYDNSKVYRLNAGDKITYLKATGQFLNFADSNANALTRSGKPKEMVSPGASERPDPDTKANDQAIMQVADSGNNLLVSDVTKILGGQVALVNNDKHKNDGLARYTRLYRLKSDKTVSLSSEVESFIDDEAAHNAFERSRSRYAASRNAEGLAGPDAEAFYDADPQKHYLLVFRKRNVLFRVIVNKPKSGFSPEPLLAALKSKGQQVKQDVFKD